MWIALSLCVLLTWGLISSRIPWLGIPLNVAILAGVIVGIVRVVHHDNSRSEMQGLADLIDGMATLGLIVVGFLAIGGVIASITRLVEKPEIDAALPVARRIVRRRARV